MSNEKTVLYDLHAELGARFGPFAGYDMPLQYREGLRAEHLHTRSQAGFFDVSHMGQVRVTERRLQAEGSRAAAQALSRSLVRAPRPGADRAAGPCGRSGRGFARAPGTPT